MMVGVLAGGVDGINTFLFVWFYLFYDLGPRFFYTRHLLGVSTEEKVVTVNYCNYSQTCEMT